MTIGSAASVPGLGAEAPFPSFRAFRRNGCLPGISNIPTASAPQRLFPKIVAIDDPPRGRILIATDQASLALDVQRILFDAGYRAVGPAQSAKDAERLIGQRPIDGAVIDAQLKGGVAADFAHRLDHEGIPFVWLTDESRAMPLDTLPHGHEPTPIATKPVKAHDLIRALEHALASARRSREHMLYPVPPPLEVWPRVFPQL